MADLSRIPLLLRRIASKPIAVIQFRLVQAIRLAVLRFTGGWQRIAARASELGPVGSGTILLCAEPAALTPAQREDVLTSSQRVLESSFPIFGHTVPELEHADFHQDWRFGHRWAPDYFKNYDFYVQKDAPYDVKMPWELSRLFFLVPVLMKQVIGRSSLADLAWIAELLDRWDAENPLAYSVNWYPMEASMRLINFVIMLDLIKLAMARDGDGPQAIALSALAKTLARLIFKHAHFVWFTREYTDVRGNHYTANVVALYLAGLALRGASARAETWVTFAYHCLDDEIRLQFYCDGVNYEKSCDYHKLVLELFTLAGIAAERSGSPLESVSLDRLENAAVFCDAVSRPDGRASNFGDTDQACAIPFNLEPERSHGAIVEVVRAWRQKALGGVEFRDTERLAAAFLVGTIETHRQPMPGDVEVLAFEDGGYFVVRNQTAGFFFAADMGEVGMHGRGGHGHNDLLSFELFIDGEPIVLDPGCSGYTADLAKKDFFRSTSAHSTVELFGEEMAELTGPWTIGDDAKPIDVGLSREEDNLVLSATHRGYSRFRRDASVTRVFVIDPVHQTVRICDEISLTEPPCPARWRFPVGGASVSITEAGDESQATIGPAVLTSALTLTRVSAPFSSGYAQEEVGAVVECGHILREQSQVFEFEIARNPKEKRT